MNLFLALIMSEQPQTLETAARLALPAVASPVDQDSAVEEYDLTSIRPARRMSSIRRRSSASTRPHSRASFRLTQTPYVRMETPEATPVATPADQKSQYGLGRNDDERDAVDVADVRVTENPFVDTASISGEGGQSIRNRATEVSTERESGDEVEGAATSEWNDSEGKRFFENRGKLFKFAFACTACSAQLIAQGQFGMVLIPIYQIGAWLGTQEQGELGWMTAANG